MMLLVMGRLMLMMRNCLLWYLNIFLFSRVCLVFWVMIMKVGFSMWCCILVGVCVDIVNMLFVLCVFVDVVWCWISVCNFLRVFMV